ncbi:MAG: hypothetical protein WKF83_12450 [Nocardioidaceae bacterium]
MVQNFAMPGADIAGFQRKAVEMAVAGVYDLRQHRDDVVDAGAAVLEGLRHRGARRPR